MAIPNGLFGGPDDLRPQHLKDLVSDNAESASILDDVTNVVNLLLEGGTPEPVCPVLFGGALTAIAKKGGGVRPIAVDYSWTRVVNKVACNLVSERAAALLAPKQLGVGVPGDAEAAVHATRRYLDNLPQGHILLKVDFSNAFNSVCNDALFEAVAKYLPDLLPYASSCHRGRQGNVAQGE